MSSTALTPIKFEAGGKSLASVTVDNGDLIIEGWAAVFDNIDRQGEGFKPGAFERGIKAFMDGQSPLAYNHKHDKILGKVLELREVPGKGLWMKARVDGEIRTHPELGTIYGQIKKGTINALSVGGWFQRALVNGKRWITSMEFSEVSCTALPVDPKTSFSVVAGKALMDDASADFAGFDDQLARLRLNLMRSQLRDIRRDVQRAAIS